MNPSEKKNDVLGQAIGELRNTPIAEGPPAELVERTRASLQARQSAAEPQTLRLPGLPHFPRFPARLFAAAAALLVILGLAATLMYMGGGTSVYAQIQKQIEEAQTVSFDAVTGDFPGDDNLGRLSHVQLKQPGLMRVETPGGAVTIVDFPKGKMLTLFPEAKVALVADLSNKPSFMTPHNLMAEMKQVIDSAARPLGARREGNRQFEGFQFTRNGRARNVWADAKTGSPAEIEILGTTGRPILIFRDVAFNRAMGNAIFSIEPPEGYQVHQSETSPTVVGRWPTEQDLVAALLVGAQTNGGMFPASLETSARELVELSRKGPAKGADDLARRIALLGCGTAFESLMGASHYQYAGQDTALGDARRPVCWWKQGNGWRTVWGDLSITDEGRIPTTRPASPRGPTL